MTWESFINNLFLVLMFGPWCLGIWKLCEIIGWFFHHLGAGMKVRAEELAKRDAEIERLRAALENLLAEISAPSWKDSRLDYENRQITNGAVDAARLALKATQTPKAKVRE
jgi:hypothetical protein